MIIADEGLNGNLVRSLRADGYQVIWIKELNAGMKDRKIIELARQNNKVIITEDKDFGEWVFAHRVSELSIIFLRYDKEDYEIVLSLLRSTLQTLEVDHNEFVTINRNKVRRRRI